MIRRRSRSLASARCAERGYAILLVLFCVGLFTIAALAAAPNVLTEGKRQKEEEMIWRGKQYVRGIKLYYRKNNRFPTQLEDLYKSKQIGVRYMRQAYKDPMNKEDGSWRLIYVGPAGNLIGSLKPPQNNLQMPKAAGFGTPAGQQPSAGAAQGAAPGAPAAQSGPSGTPGQGPAQSADGDSVGQETGASANGDLPPSLGSGDTPAIIGGNIIGVGSKVNQRSVRIYEKAKNYRLFEFIWDPSKDAATAFGQPGVQTGTGLGTPAGTTPPGAAPSAQPGNPGAAQPPDGPPTQGPPQNP